jgi:hypothetical protein
MSILGQDPFGIAVGNTTTGTAYPGGTATGYPGQIINAQYRPQPFTFTIDKAENGFVLTRVDNGTCIRYLAMAPEDIAKQVVAMMIAAKLTETP